jgi:hypothetical protein
LINYNKVLLLALPDRLIAHNILELNNLPALHVGKFSLRLNKLFALFCGGVEEPRVDLAAYDIVVFEMKTGRKRDDHLHLRLLIFQTDVEGKNECVFQSLRHIWVSASMVEHQTADKLRLRGSSMLHLHNLNHMEINGISPLLFSF